MYVCVSEGKKRQFSRKICVQFSCYLRLRIAFLPFHQQIYVLYPVDNEEPWELETADHTHLFLFIYVICIVSVILTFSLNTIPLIF